VVARLRRGLARTKPPVREAEPAPTATVDSESPPRDADAAPPAPADAAARIDAVRERLRATIEPPRDEA
jgi:hypothetical protein